MFEKSFRRRQELRRVQQEAEEKMEEDVEQAVCVQQQKTQCSLVLGEQQEEQCFLVLVDLEMSPRAPRVNQYQLEDDPDEL